MPKIHVVDDLSKDLVNKHAPFIICDDTAKKGEKFKVRVKVGQDLCHPADADHFIEYIQLWDGEVLVAQVNLTPQYAGGKCEQVQVDFYVVPAKSKMKLTAISYCTKHGLWESEPKEVKVEE